METAHLFFPDFEEIWEMQRTALFLGLVRERSTDEVGQVYVIFVLRNDMF